jgi:hypothetical protein
MKVHELQEQLGRLNPELDVLCYTEDPSLVAKGHGLRLLDITEVKATRAGE